MATDALTDEDEQYDSTNDSDFAPGVEPDIVSDDDTGDEGRKRKISDKETPNSGDTAEDDVVYENSGDEAIITKGKKKLKKAKDADDEGGDGGLIKTRAQRAAEKEERRYATNTGPVTVDVDAIWKRMLSGQPIVAETTKESNDSATKAVEPKKKLETQPVDPADTIKIKRTYNFAGKVHTEEKTVARDSAEAKLYLASEEGQATSATADGSPPKRATRKAFRSAFEPLVVGVGDARRLDLNLGLTARAQAARELQAKKLTTVEKSRMDWAGYVDKEGIQDELALAGRSKDSYAGRQDFLARSQAIRDEDSRRARMAGRT
ncbi:SWR1-complex protein 5 [Cordyceps militaris CM01]|uniref:SWR1-complex protein 5 n=1 Tax=Cordyceps militaris (strain CM01) TaxID=983644 RepID=G3J525_CORMM|nr:SWR1-complex protein 5 [Cordyceps militaris CM01]EGX96788.1 SWR1-complex protein 5 [Cordyceps militaris CM01]